MKAMKTFLKCALFLCVLAMASAAFAGDEKTCDISFIVLRDYNGKPIRYASVVLHPVDKNGKQKANGVELKADADGKTSFAGLPYGKVRVQVLAPGFQTFGEDYEINQPSKSLEIRLKKPQGQYSVYGNGAKDDKPAKPPEKKDK